MGKTYIISESKLNNSILNYLDEKFPIENIHYFNPYEFDDETGEEYEDADRVQFYLGDHDEEDYIFKWYGCEYFDEGSHARTICPTVLVESPYDDVLLSYFGELWVEPFKLWFEENFSLPVKTVEWF